MIEAAISAGVVLVGAVAWLVRLEGKANTACKDAKDARDDISEIKRGISNIQSDVSKIAGFLEGREGYKK